MKQNQERKPPVNNDFTITHVSKISKLTGRVVVISNGGNEISFNK